MVSLSPPWRNWGVKALGTPWDGHSAAGKYLPVDLQAVFDGLCD